MRHIIKIKVSAPKKKTLNKSKNKQITEKKTKQTFFCLPSQEDFELY